MRLINTRSLDLEEFVGSATPRYGILSHTWEGGEVSFQEWHDRDTAAKKPGYGKIVAACKRALADRLDYLWVDTNCIDKKSSAELSEAINSMFAWYANSKTCYVYLADLHRDAPGIVDTEELRKCRWFTRGWTLQELLAPQTVLFFDSNWRLCGDKDDGWFRVQLSEITLIESKYFEYRYRIYSASISARMSWAAHRETTREEDIAYCLLGIFGINMPLLYGEGKGAFLRLQEEIIRISNDQTIFCWSNKNAAEADKGWEGVLALYPRVFSGGGKYIPDPNVIMSNTSYFLTNDGLRITLPVIRIDNEYSIALLGAITLHGNSLALILLESGHLQTRSARDRLRRLPYMSTYGANSYAFPSRQFQLKYRPAQPLGKYTVFEFPQELRPCLVLLPVDDILFFLHYKTNGLAEGQCKPQMSRRALLEAGIGSLPLNGLDDIYVLSREMMSIGVFAEPSAPEFDISVEEVKSVEEILSELKAWMYSKDFPSHILPLGYLSILDPNEDDRIILVGNRV